MKVGEQEHVDFSTVSYNSYKYNTKTPIRRYATVFAITFCIIGFFMLFTSVIVIFQHPAFIIPIAERIIFASLPFVSFNEEVIGIIPTSVLFLLLSLIMFLLKDEKRFTFIQCALVIVGVVSSLYFLMFI